MPEGHSLALAFDFGLARIGVAVGSLDIATARGVEVVANHSGTIDWAKIDRLVDEWRPGVLVVGEPGDQIRTDSRLPRALRRFCNDLSIRYQLPVQRISEDFSSLRARTELRAQRQAGVRKRLVKGDIDKMAAAYILDTWLAEQDAVARKN